MQISQQWDIIYHTKCDKNFKTSEEYDIVQDNYKTMKS